jgi:hypothetical protein
MLPVHRDERSVKVLRLIGYWAEDPDDGWPDPAAFVDPDVVRAAQHAISTYLRKGTVFAAAAGFSACRLCGRANGSTEMTDGEFFTWPEGLAHYVDDHGVRLPDTITQVMVSHEPGPVDPHNFEQELFERQTVVIDDGWWRNEAARKRDERTN